MKICSRRVLAVHRGGRVCIIFWLRVCSIFAEGLYNFLA